jgi:hypothetical protein
MQAVYVGVPEVAMARLAGRILPVRIEAAHPNSLAGALLAESPQVDDASQAATPGRTLARITA